MLQPVFRWLSPKGMLDGAVKVVAVVALIAGADMLFERVHHIYLDQGALLSFARAAIVGGPWVVLFFVVCHSQLKLQKTLSLLSRKDGLTGLNNRRTFFDLCRRRKSREGGVLMMLDADNFKLINDTYGHAAGDACLQAIAYRLKRNLRETDVAGRIGGEEFAVYLSGADVAAAQVIAERFVSPIAFNNPEGDEHLTVTLSIGAVTALPANSLDQLLCRADTALYSAKSQGRARTVFWKQPA